MTGLPHPRPLLRRERWTPLDGEWEFALDPEARWKLPSEVTFNQRIRVPFAPETDASGIGRRDFFSSCWYRRRIDVAPPSAGERVFVRFEAVDYGATAWLNDRLVAQHEGGYTPFSADLTGALRSDGENWLVVRAADDPQDLAKPRGKQDWLLEPHAIWYPRTSGIWQSVWLEPVPTVCLESLRWTPNLERWEIMLEVHVGGQPRDGTRLHVRLQVGNLLLADDSYQVVAGEVSRRIALSDPGVDDYRNELLWSPTSPTLIEARLELRAPDGAVLDRVASYTALRAIGCQGPNIVVNGRPFPLRMVLDQGYWPHTGLTAPDDDALRRDIELAKAMGFNGVRKHQKVEARRWLYWADRLGLLVWEEMPSPYRFTMKSVQRLAREWLEVMERDVSHPCIGAWVPFNESWGVPNLPEVAAQRHFVEGLYHLTRTIDTTRPVVGNDGWESIATDIIGIHDYTEDPAKLAARYAGEEEIPHLFRRERPGGRLLALDGHEHTGQPIVLSEFGGIAFSPGQPRIWGHSFAFSSEQFAERYCTLMDVVRNLKLLAGFCYTQFADTYQEANGLLTADRTPKFEIGDIALATRGPVSPREEQAEQEWRERMESFRRNHAVVEP